MKKKLTEKSAAHSDLAVELEELKKKMAAFTNPSIGSGG